MKRIKFKELKTAPNEKKALLKDAFFKKRLDKKLDRKKNRK